jgi:type IV pilus assembly protein PilA
MSTDGFTLIELLVVMVIIAVLIAIAVPSYLGFKKRAADSAAKANLRASLPAAEAYYADAKTYVGMTPATMRSIDAGLSPTLTVVAATATNYCMAETISGETWSVNGPGTPLPGYFSNGTCS